MTRSTLYPRLLSCSVFALELVFACGGCTEFRNVRGMATSTDAGSIEDGGTAPQDDAEPVESTRSEIATAATACSTEGARACAGNGSPEVLVCDGTVWKPAETCKDGERCDSTPGPRQGQCHPIATECQGKMPGERFCDASNQMRVCKDLVSSEVIECGRQRRCATFDDQAECVCMPGSVDTGSGCREATDCAADEGGCDRLTRCSMEGSERICSACPTGYLGDGLSGCIPQLNGLELSCGELVSGPTDERPEYRVRASLLCQRIELSVELPQDAQLAIDGTKLTGNTWTSSALVAKETKFQMLLSSPSGMTRQYTLIVERAPAEDAYIKASNPGNQDCFGLNAAAWGESFIVGAPYEDSAAGGVNGNQSSGGATNSGAAYVFVRRGDSWVQEAYLKADTPVDGQHFGTSVSIHGDVAVVGAPNQDPHRFNSVPPTRTGSAYVFVRRAGAWTFDTKLEPNSTGSANLYGFKVAVHGDTILVSDPEDDTGASRSGAIYVYTRGASGWTEKQKLKAASPIRDSAFGLSIALDGNTMVTGAALDSTVSLNSGSAYVFVLRDGSWREQAHLRPRLASRAAFGWQVAVQGDTIAVGAPAIDLLTSSGASGRAFVFERAGDEWPQTAMLSGPVPRVDDYFGSAVSLSGASLLIGGNGESSGARGAGGDPNRRDGAVSGAAYMFLRGPDGWTQTTYLKAPNADAQDNYGVIVSLTETLAIVTVPFEDSSSAGIDGDQASNGSNDTGAVFVYR